jgi:hypothetical protein
MEFTQSFLETAGGGKKTQNIVVYCKREMNNKGKNIEAKVEK